MSDCTQSFDVKMKRPKEFRMAELFIEEGTKDHSLLENRDAADQHPIEAVTGLRDELNSKATLNPETVAAREIMVYSEDGTLGCCGHTMDDLVLKSELHGANCYMYEQETPSNLWTINHNLEKYPAVTTIDSNGNTVVGEVQHLGPNSLVIRFSTAISGNACLN